MANILPKEKQLQVIHLLVEGNSIRSIERLTGVQKKTTMRLLVKFGNACKDLLDERMRDLNLRHVQADEIWTFVGKKENRIPDAEKTHLIGDQFVYVALDTDTKLIASFAIGKRSADLTRRFMVDLAQRVVTGNIFRNEPVVQVSTDGFKCYPEAVDLAFGPNVKFGTIVKDFRNAVRPYTPSEIVGSRRRGIFNIGGRQERTICTSHVERSNLTIRTFIRRFTRLTLGFSKKLENLAAAVALHVAHYNFCRIHGSLRCTPAMAAEVTNAPWTLEELYEKALSGK
jgi:IS1 family transposase